MIQTARHRRIEQLLEEHGACSVEELARQLGVSGMTVRRDLQQLAQVGRIVRTHGRAAPAEHVMFEFQFLRRAQQNAKMKEQIGSAAAALVHDGAAIVLDSGTTTLELARQLRQRHGLTVITTSLPIAAVLQHSAGIETVLLGGVLRRDTPDLGGPLTEKNLENLRADMAFIGADGIDLDGQAYNGSLGVARMLEKMAASATAVYLVADSSKLGRTALVRFGNAAQWQGLITDGSVAREQVQMLRSAEVNVIIAGDGNDAASEDPNG